MRAPEPFLRYPDLRRWISFNTGGQISVRTGKVEIGQGILTALRQIVADELCVDIDVVEMMAASTAFGPDEGYTVGSLSVEQSGPTMRYLGALMRERLLRAARGKPPGANEALSVVNGRVLLGERATDLSYFSFGSSLIEEAVNPDAEVEVLSRDKLKYVGKSAPRVDLRKKLEGGAFIQDLELPGMLHGRVVRRPHESAKVEHIDIDRLRTRYPSGRWVVRNNFVGCVADTEAQAIMCYAAMESAVEWDGAARSVQPASNITDWLRSLPLIEQRQIAVGAEARTDSAGVLSGAWSRPFIAHASIGLSTALAWLQDGKLEVWSHSQGIFFLREQMARILDYPLDSIQVHHAAGSGCYGHNGADDVALDAALLALAFPGQPIRVQWNRKDELKEAPFGAAGVAELKVGFDNDGKIQSWHTHILGTSHGARPGMHGEPNLLSAPAIDSRWENGLIADTPESNGGGASRNARPIYDTSDYSLSLSLVKPPFRSSALRALGAHLNVVSIEGMMDELAMATASQPMAIRRKNLSDERARAVLEKALSMSDWNGEFGPINDHYYGFGLARYKERGAYCGIVVELQLEETVSVRRVWCAVDAGRVINPDGAINQIEGGIVQSLSWTLFESVPLDGATPAIEGWGDYRIAQFRDIPAIYTALIDSEEQPVGVGEVAQGPMAAAICNAVSDAIGMRVRDMPLTRERLMAMIQAA